MLREEVTLLREEERINKGEQQDSYLILLKDYINSNPCESILGGVKYPITVDFIHKLFAVEDSYAIRYDGHSGIGRWFGREYLFHTGYMDQFFRKEKIKRIKSKVLSQKISSKNCVQS